MEKSDEEFRERLLAIFREEAGEHLRELTAGFLKLETAPSAPGETLETVFRAAHSLKGAARSVNEEETEAVCQALESVLAALKRGSLTPDSGLADLLIGTVTVLKELLTCAGQGLKPASARARAAAAGRKLEAVLEEGAPAPGGAAPQAAAEASPAWEPEIPESVRVRLSSLEALVRRTEELLVCKLSAGQRALELKNVLLTLGSWKREQGREAHGGLKERLAGLEKTVRALAQAAEHDQRTLSARADELHSDVKQLLLLPFSTLLEGFPLLFRELLRSQGKEADLVIEGADLAVDRGILQGMKDPLLHLLRNAADHGLEKPGERRSKGKAERGRVTISISKIEGNKAELAVKDDGAGLDLPKVLASAVKLGALTGPDASRLEPQQAAGFVFRSGISTSPLITSVSGRGLGLAIVREKAERLGGGVSVESRPGETVFRVLVPLAVSYQRGILLGTGKHVFAVPTAQVEKVLRLRPEELKTVEGRRVISVGGATIPLTRLDEVLGLDLQPGETGKYEQAVIARFGETRTAFIVDRVLQEQEVLVKGLGAPLDRVRGVSGAAVLGTGRVVTMLDLRDLVGADGAAPRPLVCALKKKARKNILVAEDSITARTLLQNIFESAGYVVTTAMDGAAAFEALRSAPCDLLVSDVDMTGLSGFELTARIRADKKLADLPVILVTALDTREGREKGLDAGASAYIVKSRFDQSDLLETAGRLI